MIQTITTDLAALGTKPNPNISLFDDRVCATCGGGIICESNDGPAIEFCGTCFAVDLAPVQATLAVLAWAKAAGHEVDEIEVSEWTDEGHEMPPDVATPGRHWYVDLGVVEGVCAARCPVFVIAQADGQMQVVPDDFPTCHNEGGSACGCYITTDADGKRTCPEHGEVTAWNIPLSFYEDEPDVLAEDTAAFATYGTVQWFDDYEDKVEAAEDEDASDE